GRRSTTSMLPLHPRTRAAAEAVAALVATGAAVSAVCIPTAAVLPVSASDSELLLSFLGVNGTALAAISLPHLLLASFERDVPSSYRSWLRWAVPPALTAGGIAFFEPESLFGNCFVGAVAGIVVLVWAPSNHSEAFERARRRLTQVCSSRELQGSSATVFRGDLVRGLGWGFVRGTGLSAALAGLFLVARWSFSPGFVLVACGMLLAGGAWLASVRPLGLSMRTVGGRWQAHGGFSRAWSTLPISGSALARAVYLHMLACSTTGFGACVGVYAVAVMWWPASGGIAGLLLVGAAAASLALCGIGASTAMTSPRSWEFAWLSGGLATGSVLVAFLLSEASSFPTFAAMLAASPITTTLLTVAVIGGFASALAPVPFLRGRHSSVAFPTT
ncbi:MAG: hypothetical protein KUG77_12790, partial [Nannocystaceae bacterium]|nr:hypothetical protein [Nannocystaceae bacterium]